MRLTDKQRAFIEAYLQHFNATQAAKDAGYQAANDNVFATIGKENIRKPQIRAAIDARLRESAMSADEVLSRLAEQARGNMADFLELVSDHMAMVNLRKAEGASKLHLIKKFEHDKDRGVKIELYDAQAALQLLGKAHGLFTDRQEVGGEITFRVVYEDDGIDDQVN